MQKYKNASILVYVLLLIALSASMAMIVVSNVSILENSLGEEQTRLELEKDLQKNFLELVKKVSYYNSDGGGINDNFGCPQNIVMSGSTNMTTSITSNYAQNGDEIVCRASFNGENLDLLFDESFSTFSSARYNSQVVGLSGEYSKTGTSGFSDSDNSVVSFNSNYYAADGIDDNFNSDNFHHQNDQSQNYSGNIIDNDANAKIIGDIFLKPENNWKNIFWNNGKIESYIAQNPNNSFSGASLLGNDSGVLFLETDGNITLRITEFRKSDFDNYNELIPINKHEFEIGSGEKGFLRTDGSIAEEKNGNEYNFDFQNKYYAIFLKNDTGLTWKKVSYFFEDTSDQKIIIFPIIEPNNYINGTGKYSYLGYNIFINSRGRYFYKIQEFFFNKQ